MKMNNKKTCLPNFSLLLLLLLSSSRYELFRKSLLCLDLLGGGVLSDQQLCLLPPSLPLMDPILLYSGLLRSLFNSSRSSLLRFFFSLLRRSEEELLRLSALSILFLRAGDLFLALTVLFSSLISDETFLL